jgi:predicted kinase
MQAEDEQQQRAAHEGWEVVPVKATRNGTRRQLVYSPPSWFSELTPNVVNATSFEPFMLVIIGLPGSGKSTLSKKLQEIMPDRYVRINQDDLGSRPECLRVAATVLKEGSCPIIDRCNPTPEQRRPFLQLAAESGYPVDCLIMDVPSGECVRRCQERDDHPTLKPSQAKKVIGIVKSEWKIPVPGEGFRNVWHVDGASSDQRSLRAVLDNFLLI